MIIYFLTALTGILVSRMVGPKILGTIVFGYSFVSMFFFMFGLFGTSHIKLISEGKNLKNCNKIYSTIIFITFILFIVTVLAFFYIQKYYFNKDFTHEEEIIIYLTVGVIAVHGLYKIPEITFTALMHQAKINFPVLIKAVVYNIARIIVVLLGFKAIALVSVNLASAIIIVPIYYYLLGKGFFKGKWDSNLFKKYMLVGLPLLVITISLSLTDHYAKVLLKDFSSTIELGYLSGATSLASMLILLGGTAGTLFFPLFSKAFAEKNYDFIKEKLFKFEHFLFIFILPVIIVLSVNSYTIIPFLLGNQYIPSVSIFSVLVFFSFFKIWEIPYYNLINGINKFNLNAILHVFFGIFFFLLLYFTVHKKYLNLGGLGFAITLLVMSSFKLLTWYFFANKAIKIKFDKEILKFILFFVVIYLSGNYIYKIYIFDLNYYLKFAFLFLYTISIYLLLFLFKLMKKEDVNFIYELMDFKALLSYSKKEIKKK
ncbi:MAG: oligosaccharide flippase family protein [Flavobacteriaceae bacterium]|nr:oligosaccharide flippase family protein [Flavobacteriaceae bacterium]